MAARRYNGRGHTKGQRPSWVLAFRQALRTELARLADGTQALGAELHLNRDAAIERERRLLNVWLPHAASKIVSVADVVAKRGFFAAELTLCHDKTNLLDQRRALRNTFVTLSLDYTIFAACWQTGIKIDAHASEHWTRTNAEYDHFPRLSAFVRVQCI